MHTWKYIDEGLSQCDENVGESLVQRYKNVAIYKDIYVKGDARKRINLRGKFTPVTGKVSGHSRPQFFF